MKAMTAKELVASLNALTIELDEDNKFGKETIESLTANYSDALPTIKTEHGEHKITIDDVTTIDESISKWHEAYSIVTSDIIAEKAKDPEIAALELDIGIGKRTFTTTFSRPSGDAPTQKEYAASIGFGYSTPKSKSLEGKVRKEFAKKFFEEEDEE